MHKKMTGLFVLVIVGLNLMSFSSYHNKSIKQKQNIINVKSFGAKADGITNDSAAIIKAAQNLNNGGTLLFPPGRYLVRKTLDGPLVTFKGKNNIKLECTGSTFLTDDFKDYTEASLTSSGNIASVNAANPVYPSKGNIILVKNSSDSNYNGALEITDVRDASSFKYKILATTPNSAKGLVRKTNFAKVLFEFDSCKNVVINNISFKGTVQPINNQYRLGWVVTKFQYNCSNIDVKMNVEGASYGVWSGEFNKDIGNMTGSRFVITAKNVGYPIALWKSGSNSTVKVNAENIHRGVYVGGCNNSKFDVTAKNYDIAGILITTQPVNNKEVFGCSNLIINVTDNGSDRKVNYYPFPAPRSICIIAGYKTDYPAEIKNLTINIVNQNGMYAQGLVAQTYGRNCKISNITLSGNMDRSKLIPSQVFAEIRLGDEADSLSGVYSGIKVRNFKVLNPSGGALVTPALFFPKRLTDNIIFENYISNSPKRLILPNNKKIESNTKQ